MTTENEKKQSNINALFANTSKADVDLSPQRPAPQLSLASMREMNQQELKWYLRPRYLLIGLLVPSLLIGWMVKSAILPDTPQVAEAKKPSSSLSPAIDQETDETNPCLGTTDLAKAQCVIERQRVELGKKNQKASLKVETSPKPPSPKNVTQIKNIPVAARSAPPVRTIVRTVPKTETRVVYRDRPSEPVFTPPPPAVAYVPPARQLDPEEVYKNLGDQIVISGGSSGGSTGYTPAVYTSPNESSPYPIASGGGGLFPDSEGSNNEAASALGLNSKPVQTLGYALPLGSTATARFQQSLSWDSGKTPETPIFLTLDTPFKDRQGNKIGNKGAYLTGKIVSTSQGCGYNLEITDIDSGKLPSGSLVASNRAKFKRSGGTSLGTRILSGILNVGGQYAANQSGVDNLGIAVGANVAGSLIDGGQSSLYSSNTPTPTTCEISQDKKINILVSSEIN